jgi:hypothetical protein
MKNLFAALLLILVSFTLASAQGEYIKRLSDSKRATAETGSYTYVLNVNVSAANWTVPDSVIILGICVDSAGTIKIDSKESTGAILKKTTDFCYPINVTKIYMTGTDAALRNGYITVFGFKKN